MTDSVQVVKDRVERFVYSGTTNHRRGRMAITGPYSRTRDYLSEDQEDHFVARDDLSEPELYFVQSTRRTSRKALGGFWCPALYLY